MSLTRDVAVRKRLEDFCQAREQVVQLMSSGLRCIEQAHETLSQHYVYGLDRACRPANDRDAIVQSVDRTFWRVAFRYTGLAQLMDDEAVTSFEKSLESAPPAFTLDNVTTTVLAMHQQADEMFQRGVYNVFRKLDRCYRTNDAEPFRISRKNVLHWMFESDWDGGLRVNYHARATWNDLDRVMTTLDGKRFEAYRLEAAVNKAFARGAARVYEDQYFRIKGFKNQNAHLELRRADLLEKANQLIAAYCHGRGLADGRPRAA